MQNPMANFPLSDTLVDALELERQRFLQPHSHLSTEKQSQLWCRHLSTATALGATTDQAMEATASHSSMGLGIMDSTSKALSPMSPRVVVDVAQDASMQNIGDWSDGYLSATPASESMSRSCSQFSASPGLPSHETTNTSYDAWSTPASGTWPSRREGPVNAYLPFLTHSRQNTTAPALGLELPVGEMPEAYLERVLNQLPDLDQPSNFSGAEMSDRIALQNLSASSHYYPPDNSFAHLPSPSSKSMAELTFATTASTISRQGSTAGSSVLPDSFDQLVLNPSRSHEEHSTANATQSPSESVGRAMLSYDATSSDLLYGTGGVSEGHHPSRWTDHSFSAWGSFMSGPELQRTTSNESNKSSASSRSTASMRHLANSQRQQKLLPKGSTRGSAPSRSTYESARVPGDRRIKKVAINRVESCHSKRPKLSCSQCDDPAQGFRGEHELRRHMQREHSTVRSVWVCTEDATNPSPYPHIPISNCKQCKEKKAYNAEYNAAAHLRRRHFGGKASSTGNRGGTSGGTWPPMEVLRRFIKEDKIPRDSRDVIPEAHIDNDVEDHGRDHNDDEDLDECVMLEDESVSQVVEPADVSSSIPDESAFPPCTNLQESNVSSTYLPFQASNGLAEQAISDVRPVPISNYETSMTPIDLTYQYSEMPAHRLDGVMVDVSQHNSDVDQVASSYLFDSSLAAYVEETSLFPPPHVSNDFSFDA